MAKTKKIELENEELEKDLPEDEEEFDDEDEELEDENYSYIDDNGNFDESINYTFVNTKKPVKIGKRCWIGVNSIILPGVTIGDNVIIGAGSVVTSDIPSNMIAVGSPARVIRKNL